MTQSTRTLLEAAHEVLKAAAPEEKTQAARRAKTLLEAGAPLGTPRDTIPPERPARPERPPLVPPRAMQKRRLGSLQGRIALLHAISHIEFNAINLAFDMAVRFASEISELGLDPQSFVADWVQIGEEEARHFQLISLRLRELGAAYGDLPAHDGLWEAAAKTAHNVAARLTVAPLILEARGLDVTPDMINRLRAVGDGESADLLQVIYDEEIGHVACGKHWFETVCTAQNRDSASAFQSLRAVYFPGPLKPPFNHEGRSRAGLSRAFYELK